MFLQWGHRLSAVETAEAKVAAKSYMQVETRPAR